MIAAHDEREVIEERVRNALALDYPPDRLEVIVASDGSTDGTAELARAARGRGTPRPGAGPRRGAARSARRTPPWTRRPGDVLAFSDANALWEPDALQALVRPFSDEGVGYVCGCLSYLSARRLQSGGRLLALRERGAGAREPARLGDRRQRRDLCGEARRVSAPRPAHQPRPVVPLQPGEARVARRVRACGARDGAAGRHPRERVPPQAAHDEPRLAGGARWRPAGPARLRAAVRAGGLLAPGRCATRRRSCT